MAVALQQEHGQVVSILTEASQKGRVKLSALHVAAKKDDVRAAIMLLENEQNQGDRSRVPTTHSFLCVCMCIGMNVCASVCVCVCVHICLCNANSMCLLQCVCVYVCLRGCVYLGGYLWVYVCMYV